MTNDSGGLDPIDQHYQGKSFEQAREDALDANFPERITRDLDAEAIAKAFHEGYERIAPELGYKTREASAVPWDQVPDQNKRLMVATTRWLLDQHLIQPGSHLQVLGLEGGGR